MGVCHRYLDYNASQKDFLKSVRNLHISLLASYSFGIETIICSYSPVVSSKTISDPRPKWAKSIPFFRPKRRKNHISPLSGASSCPCWFEDGWGTLSYSYLKMVNSLTKNLTENLPKDKGTPPLSTTPMQRGIEIAGAGQDRVGRDA